MKSSRKINVRTVSKPSPLQVGLQVSRGICAQTTAESDLWLDPPAIGNRVPRLGPAKRMSDPRRALDAGPCAHVHCHTPEAPSSLGDRVSQGEERHCHRTDVREGEEFFR